MVGAVRKHGGSEEEEWMAELMDHAVSGLCTPLKVGPDQLLAISSCHYVLQNRVHQTVRSQESSITSYKIANLLQFYLLTMQRTIGGDAVLSKALREYASSICYSVCC